MSFYTALTGLNAATAQLGVTSNNIANVGTAGFKRSRADFGDIFATSPLQKASSVIGQGVALKSVTQEFSQGNIQFSASSLDVAITGDGFFPLKSADGLQDIFTRNGTFLLDDSFAVVNSAGQALQAASVDSSGKADLDNLRKLIIPRSTTGDARETTQIELSLNVPADGEVINAEFDELDPSTYNLTTAVTVFDAGGNEYLATVYYAKTQRASPDAPENKWQTYVYIGETKLDEFLIQASDTKGEDLYVNKYGQVQPESAIPPQDIARGITKLFNLDRLTDKQPSQAAEFEGAAIDGTIVSKLASGTFDVYNEVIDATGYSAGTISTHGIAVSLNIDNSPTPVEIELDDLFDSTADPLSGVELARVLEGKINKAYGDLRTFDLSDLRASTDSTDADYHVANLFTVRVVTDAGVTTEKNISIDVDADNDGTTEYDLSALTIEDLQTLVQAQLNAVAADENSDGDTTDADDGGFGTTIAPTFSYSPSSQTLLFAPASGTTVSVKSYGTSATTDIFDLTSTYAVVDDETDSYGGLVIPNGDSIREYEARYSDSDQRTGIRVRFDATAGTFSIFSGTTGDESSVEILYPTVEATASSTGALYTADTYPTDPATSTDANVIAFEAFKAIFAFEPGETAEEELPTRGVRSSPASVLGTPIGLNLDNRFTLSSETNKFTVTVDNVTGLIELPIGEEFTKESFREALEFRINSLEDTRGRSVNGVKVTYESVGNTTQLRVTTGTEGDDSFLKVTGPSIWGLQDLASGRGITERWLVPPQAENANGVPLYVDRDGNETTQAGDFSEDETRELWSPIFLDKGELTFNTAGNLVSPRESIAFKATTIGDTGATLQFSINYDGSTQFSSPFSVLAQDQNGRPEGDLIGLDIGDDGLVSANYSNGSQKNLAKVVLANFSAPTGLRQIGDASYFATSKSGATTLGEAGTAGFGTVRAGARERANVDLTQELIELITAQRNFQANAKAIETNNTLTQAIINIRS
jgi:flagellar hook-basal body protein